MPPVGIEKLSRIPSAPLGLEHWPEIFSGKGIDDHKSDHKQAVEAKPDGIEKDGIAIAAQAQGFAYAIKESDLIANPGTDDGKAGDRCTRGIDEKGQLFPTDAIAICQLLHRRAH